MSSNQYDLDPQFIKCIGYMYASKNLRKGDPVPLQNMLEEAILQKCGLKKDYTELFQSLLPPREPEEIIISNQTVVTAFEESKGSSSDNELELDLFKDDLMCIVCNGMDVGANNRLLECCDCHSLYHQECHSPPVTTEDSFENWGCHNCKEAKKIKLSTVKKESNTPMVTNSSTKNSSKSDSHLSSSSHDKKSSKSSEKHKSSSISRKSSPNQSSSKSSSGNSNSSSRNNLQPNINIVSADKRIQIMKKKAASKLQEKRKMPR